MRVETFMRFESVHSQYNIHMVCESHMERTDKRPGDACIPIHSIRLRYK